MDPQSQLVETLRAAGGRDLLEKRDKLGELYDRSKSLEEALFHEKARLDNLIQQNKLIEIQVQRFKEREEHLENVLIGNIRLHYVIAKSPGLNTTKLEIFFCRKRSSSKLRKPNLTLSKRRGKHCKIGCKRRKQQPRQPWTNLPLPSNLFRIQETWPNLYPIAYKILNCRMPVCES